jgi:hypothetical protein
MNSWNHKINQWRPRFGPWPRPVRMPHRCLDRFNSWASAQCAVQATVWHAHSARSPRVERRWLRRLGAPALAATHERRMEGAPGKVKVMETHHGGRATTRGNNGGVHWRLTTVGRLWRPATSSVRPCSMRPMRGRWVVAWFEEGRHAGPGSLDEAADGSFDFNSDDGGGTPVGRSGHEVEEGEVVLMACAERGRGGEKRERQWRVAPFLNWRIEVGDGLADGATRWQHGGEGPMTGTWWPQGLRTASNGGMGAAGAWSA